MRLNRWYVPLIFTGVILFILSPLIFSHKALLGVDTLFQYNRVYEAARQLTDHNHAFNNIYSFEHTGRVVNAMYSPLVTWIFGGILVLVGTWYKFQLVTVFLVHFIAAMCTYWAARRLRISVGLAIIAGILYTSSAAIYGYVNGGTWRALALMLVPLIVAPLQNLYAGNWSTKQMVQLGALLALMLQMQVLTVLLVLPMLIPFFIRGMWVAHSYVRSLARLAVGALVAVLLSLNVILPIVEIYRTNDHIMAPIKMHLAQQTSHLLQPVYNQASSNSNIVFSLLAFLLIASVIMYWRYLSDFFRILLLFTVTYLIAGTNLLPWAQIEHVFPTLANFLQMPKRITLIGMSLMILLISKWASNIPNALNPHWLRTGLILAAVMAPILLNQALGQQIVHQQKQTVQAVIHRSATSAVGPKLKNVEALLHQDPGRLIHAVHKGTPDYLPVDQAQETTPKTYATYQKTFTHGEYEREAASDGRLVLVWHQPEAGLKTVPVVAYARTKIWFNGKAVHPSDFKRNPVGALKVPARAGENAIVTQYAPLPITHVGAGISFFGWCLMTGWAFLSAWQWNRGRRQVLFPQRLVQAQGE